jgi:hypothetical protein
MATSEYEITIDEAKYKLVRQYCKCGCDCYPSKFYIDDSFYGDIDNPGLVQFIGLMIETLNKSNESMNH